MSSVVKVALPILGGIIGSVIPGLGTALGASLGGAVGGYIGGRSYGGGNTGGLIGAAGGAAGGYLSGGYGASDWLGSLGSGAATSGTATGASTALGELGSGAGSSAAAGGFTDVIGDSAASGMNPAFTDVLGDTAASAGGSAFGGFTDVLGDSAASGLGASGMTGADGAGGMALQEGATPSSLDGSNLSPLDKLRMAMQGKGAIRGGINVVTGAMGLQEAQRLRSQSDPFAKYRAGYGAQLASLEANPSSITTMPGYKAGLQAVQRAGAAQGYSGSGNMAAALAGYGQGFFNDQTSRLATLAGAGAPVGQGAAAGYVADNNAMRGIGNGLGAFFGG